MTKAEKRSFAREISRNIANHFVQLLDNGQIPTNWDGHEIRCWLAERHEYSADMSMIRKEPRSSRARSYRNDKLTYNL